jgi:hypothetical protein
MLSPNDRACRIIVPEVPELAAQAKTGKGPQLERTPARTRFASRCLWPLSASWFEFAVSGQLRPDCRGTRVNAASAASFNPDSQQTLALQLPTCFEMGPLSGGLVSSAPE